MRFAMFIVSFVMLVICKDYEVLRVGMMGLLCGLYVCMGDRR